LEPGHILMAGPGRAVRIERYWDVRFEPDHGRSESFFVERLRELLEESVRLHLVSDVPVGAFLSGGVDSGAVVACMSKRGREPVKTFSIGFTEQDYDELEHARLVARTFGTEHFELVLEPDALDLIEEICWHLDEPLGDPSVIPTYMVAKLAAESVTVVLSGDGGDELFAGYDKYVVEGRERRREPPAAARWLAGQIASAMPDAMRGRNFLRHLSLAGTTRYIDATTLFHGDEHARLFRPEARALVACHGPGAERRERLSRVDGHWLSSLQYADLHGYLPRDILTKVDRMSMAHSIEARVPLLDHTLVEFAATIPPELQLRNGTTKYAFKRALEGILPPAILSRPKHGFAVPLGRWFRGGLAGFVRDLLLSRPSRDRGIIDPASIERLLMRHQRRNLDFQLWSLITFELWCRLFLDRRATKPALVAPLPHPPIRCPARNADLSGELRHYQRCRPLALGREQPL